MKTVLASLLIGTMNFAVAEVRPPVEAPKPKPAEPKPHPVFAKLKTYRNYFILKESVPYSHEFWVWFRFKNKIFTKSGGINGDTPEEIAKAKWRFNIEHIRAKKPTRLPGVEVPKAFAKHVDAIKKSLEKLAPGHTELMIRYMGKHRSVTISSHMPIQGNEKPYQRHSIGNEFTYRMNKEMTKFTTGTGPAAWGSTFVCFKNIKSRGCQKKPNFINYVLPPYLVGTPLLAVVTREQFNDVDWRHRRAFAQLKRQIIKTIRALEAGTYQNPIESVLARQGSSILPRGFDQDLQYVIRIKAHPKDKSKPIGHGLDNIRTIAEPHKSNVTTRVNGTNPIRLRYPIKTSDFFNKGGFVITRKIEQVNFRISTTLSWRNKVVAVAATNLQTGETKSMSMKIDPNANLLRKGRFPVVSEKVVLLKPIDDQGKPQPRVLRFKSSDPRFREIEIQASWALFSMTDQRYPRWLTRQLCSSSCR